MNTNTLLVFVIQALALVKVSTAASIVERAPGPPGCGNVTYGIPNLPNFALLAMFKVNSSVVPLELSAGEGFSGVQHLKVSVGFVGWIEADTYENGGIGCKQLRTDEIQLAKRLHP